MSSSNKKVESIQQYDLVVYPVNFTVVVGDAVEEVNSRYMPFEEKYRECKIEAPRYSGCTYKLIEKSTNKVCVLIWFPSNKDFTADIATHECVHAALEIFEYIEANVQTEEQEPFAYLVGNLMRLAWKSKKSEKNDRKKGITE